MTKHKWLDARAGFLAGTLILTLGLIAPTFLPAFASASSLKERSIAMSSNKKGDTNVSYQLKVNDVPGGIASGGGMIIEFCTNSPLVGTTCTHPSNMTVASVSASTGTASDIDATDHTTIEWTPASPVAANGSVDVTFSGITNPDPATTPHTFYARVTSYTSSTDLNSYTNATNPGTYEDNGGIALSISNQVGVTAYIQESMTFCVSHTAPDTSCSGTVDSPSLILGEDQGNGVYALETSTLSTGTDYAQLSTNAAHGAVVSLHSDATGCGGLVRPNDGSNCDISAQNNTANTIAAGEAKFGLKVGPDAAASGSGTVAGSLVKASDYDNSKYFIDYVSGDATGVTSTYGSKLFDSNGGPVASRNMPFTFGTSTALNTPAGVYKANLSLIATGTF